MINEYAPDEAQLVVPPKEESFVAIFKQLRPGAEVPAWQKGVLGVARSMARTGARIIDVVDPA